MSRTKTKFGNDEILGSLSTADSKAIASADASDSEIKNWADFELVLKRMNTAYKRAAFDSHLQVDASRLHQFIRNQEKREEPNFWKAVTLIYELNDIFRFEPDDIHSINEAALNVGQLVYNELRGLSLKCETTSPLADHERALAREKVLYCACYGNELRRRGRPEAAAKLFEWLLEFTSKTLKTATFPCFGTRARLTYHLGFVYRVLERHNSAEEMFTTTLELLYERGKIHSDNEDRVFITRRQAMAIGIGYGWVNATRGSLRRAKNALTTARSLLAAINDPVVPSFIELLYGTIERCLAGSSRPKLVEAVKSLETAKSSFTNNEHRRHIPRACWELSLAHNLLGNFEEAEKNLKEVDDYAKRVNHAKWQTNVLILRSRLLRNQGDLSGARELADAAVNKAEEDKSVLPLTDAYITRGEALLKIIEAAGGPSQSCELARKDFEKALDIIGTFRIKEKDSYLPSNPKIVAVCELRIAQCLARDGDETKARSHFATWEILRHSVEHEWVRELAEEVKRDIDAIVQNFTIPADDPKEWNYARNVAQLRMWLLTQSLRYTKRNYSAAAKLIGVKRGTLYQWQDDSRSHTQRARTRAQE